MAGQDTGMRWLEEFAAARSGRKALSILANQVVRSALRRLLDIPIGM